LQLYYGKIHKNTPTPVVLFFQASGYGMSIMGIVLVIIFAGGLLFGMAITH
jgi:hypothetical protein